MSPSGILRRLIYGGGGSLRDYESACLSAIAERMARDARAILELQVGAVEVLQRFSDDKLTVLHMRPLEDGELFGDRRPELRAAKFVLGAAHAKPVAGRLVIHHGRVSSLEFDRSPRGLRRQPVRADDVEVRDDLMGVARTGTALVEPPEMLDVLGLAVTAILAPASPPEQAAFLRGLETATPDDYRRLLAATDGFAAGQWRFLGTTARTLTLPEMTYVVAAERDDSTAALCFRKGRQSPAVVLFDEIDEEEQAEHADFLPALEEAAGAGER